MGIEKAERLVLVLGVKNEPGQNDVLEDVGEIACVVDVPIVHLSLCLA
jgi:hypothetical protein